MRLGFTILNKVTGYNSFSEPAEVTLQDGNPQTLWVRIVDLDQKDGECSRYLRYIPAEGSSVMFRFGSINSANTIARPGVQPFYDADRSIWSVPILPTDQITFNGLTLTLTENGVSQTLYPATMLVVAPSGSDRFFC